MKKKEPILYSAGSTSMVTVYKKMLKQRQGETAQWIQSLANAERSKVTRESREEFCFRASQNGVPVSNIKECNRENQIKPAN